MSFLVHGIDPAPFAPWFALFDAELVARGARRRIADSTPGFPCRVSLADANVGDEVLLVPFEHHPTTSPYRGAGPIYIRRAAAAMAPVTLDVVPDVLARRVLSVRSYDVDGMLVGADVVDGRELTSALRRTLQDRDVGYVHVHYAKPGCFACRVTRA